MLDVRQLCDLGEFRLDLKRGLLLYRDEIIDLPPKAFATLLVLVGADGGVVDKQELMEKVWGDVYVDDNNLTQQISLLRKVLKDPAIIKTVKGRGYRLAVPVTDAPDVQRHPTIEQVVPSESPAADVAPVTSAGVTPSARPPLPASTKRSPFRRWWLWSSAAAALTAAGLLFSYLRSRTYQLPPEQSGVYDRAFAGDVSPNGKYVAFIARSFPRKQYALFIRSLIDDSTRELPRTFGNYTTFFWSADGEAVFFVNNADLMKIAVNGGGPEWVARVGEGLKGTMNQQGVIVLGSRRGLLRVEKGSTTLLTHVKAPDTRHSMPIFLPGGDRILFTITRAKPTITRWLAVFDMNDRSWRVLRPIPSRVEYIHGQLLYVQDGTLVARPFDLETLDFTGLERRLAAPVWHKTETGEAAFSASRSTVVVMPPPRTPPLQHVTSTGKVLGTVMAAGAVEAVAAARTSDQIALITGDDQGDAGLFVYPLDGRERVRLVQGKLSSPVFSHDDARLYYAAPATSTANIHVIRIAPVREERQTLPLPSEWIVAPRDISPDGQFLLFQKWENRDGDIWYAPLSDVKRAVAFVATTQDEGETARFSPDGRRVAFVARRGEEFSLYVAAFPPIGDLAQQVATNGWRARWSSDGRRLYFARDNAVMEADLATRRTREVLRMEQPVWLLETAPDGGFLVREAELGQDRTVVTRWWPHLSRHPLALSPR